jgi:hypothetical protein
MRRLFMPILLGACFTGPGCVCYHNPGTSFIYKIKQTMIAEPALICDEYKLQKRHDRLARQAWDAMASQYGECFSEDYRRGFIDGFTDYLTFGGCISNCSEEPAVPSVPPERYRHFKYMNPAGYRAIEEWFMGFRHGASTAVASGLRQLVVVPVLNPPRFGPEPPPESRPPGAEPAAGPQAPSPPVGEMLPSPRLVPPGPVAPAAPPAEVKPPGDPRAGTPPMPPMPPMPAPPGEPRPGLPPG